MHQDPQNRPFVKAERLPVDEGNGLDRFVTAIALAATLALILLAPFAG